MAKKNRLYQRLSRPTTSVGSYKSLWIAPDHLMLVSSTGYSEEYRRIMLRDIQAIMTSGSDRRLYWSLPWGVIGVFALLFFVNGWYNHETPIASGLFLTVSLVALVWNHLLGRGCRVYVVTRVQTLLLPSLAREPRANRALRRLTPLIEAAQADLAAAESARGTDMPVRVAGAENLPPPLT